MKIIIAAILTALVALATGIASAQDRAGNDTPGEWVVVHQKMFGIWSTFCDERTTDDKLEQRCYIRYVDVFSPQPELAVIIVFVWPENGIEKFQYTYEPNTSYSGDGWFIEKDGGKVWNARFECIDADGCILIPGQGIKPLLAVMKEGGVMRHTFTDKFNKERDISWSLDGFSEAYADYRAQAEARDLFSGE